MAAPIPLVTPFVTELINKCQDRDPSDLKTVMKWVLIAVGISTLVLGGGFIGAAFLIGKASFGQIGLYLLAASALSFSATLLCKQTDYAELRTRVTPALFDFAVRKKIDPKEINSENVFMYSEMMRLTLEREEAEKKAAEKKQSL